MTSEMKNMVLAVLTQAEDPIWTRSTMAYGQWEVKCYRVGGILRLDISERGQGEKQYSKGVEVNNAP